MNSIDMHTDIKVLADEIARYLAAVDLFREVGCSPAWRPEARQADVVPAPAAAADRHA
jgi:hypothetical protein